MGARAEEAEQCVEPGQGGEPGSRSEGGGGAETPDGGAAGEDQQPDEASERRHDEYGQAVRAHWHIPHRPGVPAVHRARAKRALRSPAARAAIPRPEPRLGELHTALTRHSHRLATRSATELEAEKNAIEAKFVAYSAEAAQRVTALQHKVAALQAAVDTQTTLAAVARQAANDATSALSATQERDQTISNLQRSLAAAQQRCATLEASVASAAPGQAAKETEWQGKEAEWVAERQRLVADKDALLAQLSDGKRALSREHERCLQLEEALLKATSKAGGDATAVLARPTPPPTTEPTPEPLSPLHPKPGGQIAVLRGGLPPQSVGDGLSGSNESGEVSASVGTPEDLKRGKAPSSEEPTPQPTPAATPAPTPVTSRAPSPTPRDGPATAAAAMASASTVASMATLSSMLTSLAFGSSCVAPTSGEPAPAAPAPAPAAETAPATPTSGKGYLDYTGLTSVLEAAGWTSPKASDVPPEEAPKPRTSC